MLNPVIQSSSNPDRSFTDQMGLSCTIVSFPTRIISLVPSQTELLADLGLEAEVVGITKFCVHPPVWLKTKTIIGGTKNFHFDTIDQLKPDLIIGNKEENYAEGIYRLREKYPVWMSDITAFEDALVMIGSVGELTERTIEANRIKESIRQSFSQLKAFTGQSVLYMIWRKPWMAAGTDTFIHTLLQKMGLKNVLAASRYPELTEDAIRQLNPAYIFLSSEPYPFQEKHLEEIQHLVPAAKVMLVDGEMFSWYGSRLVKAPDYFNNLTLA